MAKDYARKYNSSRKNAPESSRRLWIITVVLIGFFGVALYFLKHASNRQAAEQPAQQTEQAAPSKKAKTKLHPEEAHKQALLEKSNGQAQPRFDFYTVLPGQQAANKGDDSGRLQATENQSLDHSTDIANDPSKFTQNGYILQLGLFDDFREADQIKAKVVLEGFDVNLTSVKTKKNVFYRVWLGVYQSQAEAEKQQGMLSGDQTDSELIKLPMRTG